MGKLGDALRERFGGHNKRDIGSITLDELGQTPIGALGNDLKESTEDLADGITKYNRIWLNNIVEETGYAINEEGGKVDGILKALNRRDGHCPCGGNGDQFLCPCHIMREHGICKCGLFRNAVDINPKNGKSTVKSIKEE